jgi:hypothetical protein
MRQVRQHDMLVRKNDVGGATYKLTQKLNVQWQDKVSPQKLAAALAAVRKDQKLGVAGANTLKQAYVAAKTAAGGTPTYQQVSRQLEKAAASVENETAKGRVNDGYVDGREGAALKSDVAKAYYKFVSTTQVIAHKATPAAELNVRASKTQVQKALTKLGPIIDAGFKLYDPKNDDDGDGLAKALRQASNDAGLSGFGRAAILTALNGASDHGDWGGSPSPADVKRLLSSAQSKLKQSDGASIVDLNHPTKAPAKKKDGVTTGVELDRTPAATGMTSRALLKFASTL